MESTKLAVIGTGLIGARHARLIHAHPRCRLVGICDVDPTHQALATELDVPFHPTIQDLLMHAQPHGAIIATPNRDHAPAVEICARYGVHVLVEKPVAATLEGARRIIRVAQAAGIRVLVGHHRRHNALVRKTRELVRGGTLGKLLGVNVLWTLKKPDPYFSVAWRTRRPGGGPLLINLIHEMDSLRFICGEIAQVYANLSSAARSLEVEDTLNISLTFADGALGTILASDASPAPWSYEATTGENPVYFPTGQNCYHFLGTRASLAFPRMELWRYPAAVMTPGWTESMEREQLRVAPVEPLEAQLAHFRRVITGKQEPVVDAGDGARSLAAVLAVLDSAENKAPVKPSAIS